MNRYAILSPIWIPAGAKPNGTGRPTEEFYCEWRTVATLEAPSHVDALARAKRMGHRTPVVQALTPATQPTEIRQ